MILEIEFSVKQVIEIILLGVIAVAGMMWQVKTIENDNNTNAPTRILVPVIGGAIFIIGTFIWGLIAINNNEKQMATVDDLTSILLKELALFGSFALKSYLGPMFLAATICMLIFFGIEFGEFRLAHWVSLFFDWIFGKAPKWIETIYYVVLFLNVVIGSIANSHADIHH